MPRANRYILPGVCYHLTHRCHNREFLFNFACDRNEYRERLRQALGESSLELLTYSITSNHTHLLVRSAEPDDISRLMQRLEGEFAQVFNLKNRRKGAFWEGRFACTMIDSGQYLWNCMKYIDLNMVRAGVVSHPQDWEWGGYRELAGKRRRYRLCNLKTVIEEVNAADLSEFRANYLESIQNAVDARELSREACWTESIAVGSSAFISDIKHRTSNRAILYTDRIKADMWMIRENGMA